MKTKRSFALLCALVFIVSVFTPALAAEGKEIIDLGDGFYAVITLEQGPMTRAVERAMGK